MLSRKSAGICLFVSLLMLSGLAAADEGDLIKGAGKFLTGTNFDLTLFQVPRIAGSLKSDIILSSGVFSEPGVWTLDILAASTQVYVLTAVVTGAGGSGITGVNLQSATATDRGYFSSPILLASPVPTSFVAEPSTASFLMIGICFAVGILRRRVLPVHRPGEAGFLFPQRIRRALSGISLRSVWQEEILAEEC